MLESAYLLFQDNMIRTAGTDEAGRGPVFGPMVVAGVAACSETLRSLHVRDSKKCTKSRRDKLYTEIINVADRIKVVKIPPESIDAMRASGKNLNTIETEAFSKIINELCCDEVYVDSLGMKFEEEIKILCPGIKIIAEFKADDRYEVVSAASILAKVERDREMEKIRRELEEITGLSVGSGYASDEKTKNFLREWFESSESFPPYIRRSWLPARRYLNGKL